MPGPIQSGISGGLTAATGVAVAQKHLENENEARKSELQELKLETSKELGKAEESIRADIMKEREEKMNDPAVIKQTIKDIEKEKQEEYTQELNDNFGQVSPPSYTEGEYESMAKDRISSHYYDLANQRIKEMYRDNPARRLQKAFAEGKGDNFFRTKSDYLKKYNQLLLDKDLRDRKTARETDRLFAHLSKVAPEMMGVSDEAAAQEFFAQEAEKEIKEGNR